jgi:uncharacterized membrane protein YqiK
MKSPNAALIVLLGLAACDGPNEKAGKEQDRAAATAAGVNYTGSGPAERAGEAQDNADNAARDAKEAEKKAIDAKARNIEKQADVAAEKLEAEADAVRDAAKKQANGLKREAEAATAGVQ